MNKKNIPVSNEYAIIWFEGDIAYTLVDARNQTVIQSRDAVARDTAGIIDTEEQLEAAEDDLRYAISTELLSNFFGWEV